MAILRLAFILAAVGAALVPLPASWVESLYSQRAYLAVQPVLTGLSNRAPFALFDVLLLAALAWLTLSFVGFVRRWRQSGAVRATAAFLLRLAAAAAVVYLAFLAAWGLNYRRVPLSTRLAFSRDRVTAGATTALAHTAIARANQLRATSDGDERGDPASVDGPAWSAIPSLLAPSFTRVQQQLAGVRLAVGARPKQTLLTYYFERSGVDGMTDPFFLETLVNRSLLPFERAFITAHEWAHLAGYADESEANFIGWLVCLQGPPAAEYSGQLALLWRVLPALSTAERAAAVRELSPGVRADLRAIAERVARTAPLVRRVSWRVYDRYLKANRVERGVESYDAALELLLGTRFSTGWVPTTRTKP